MEVRSKNAIDLLNRRFRIGGIIASFAMMLIFIGGYYAFFNETSWQRAVALPFIYLCTFPFVSIVMRNVMRMSLRPLWELLASDRDWSTLNQQEATRVLQCMMFSPWIMSSFTMVAWVVLGMGFALLAEAITPGARHSFWTLLGGVGVVLPAAFMSTLLRIDILLRPYLGKARSEMAVPKNVQLRLTLTVQHRLMIVSFLVGPYSILVFAWLTYNQMASATSLKAALQHFIPLQAFFIAVSTLLCWGFAFYIMRVVKQPLEQIQSALTSDEGVIAETFDEFGVIHQLLGERKTLEKAKQEFFAVVSHELRSPLMAIESFLRLLADGVYGDVPERVRKKSATAVLNAERLLRLVNDILDAEKLQSGKFECVYVESASDVIVERAVAAVSELAESMKVTVEVDAEKREVICDEERMVQVLINFLSNAIKNADGKPVEISAKVDEQGFVEFGVRDHGRGISKEQQPQVFEKFRQLKSESPAGDTNTKKKGTGLGLPIAKALVEQHGGTIGVESEVGKGAYFFARIPLKQELPLFHAIAAAQKN